MDTLSSSVSTLKAPNFNSTHREFCHLRTANRQRQLPPPSPQCFHFFSSTKATAISTNKSTSFSHKNRSTSPFFSTSSQASLPLTASSPYVHGKPASGYAAALLDIAQCNGSLDAVQQDAQRFSKLLQNSQIQALLTDPFLGYKEKGKAMKELFRKGKFNKHLVSLLKMLVEGNKLEMVSEVLEEFERIYDELSDTKLVWISSQKKIGEAGLLRIAKRVQELSGAVRVKVRNLVTDKLPIPDFGLLYN